MSNLFVNNQITLGIIGTFVHILLVIYPYHFYFKIYNYLKPSFFFRFEIFYQTLINYYFYIFLVVWFNSPSLSLPFNRVILQESLLRLNSLRKLGGGKHDKKISLNKNFKKYEPLKPHNFSFTIEIFFSFLFF